MDLGTTLVRPQTQDGSDSSAEQSLTLHAAKSQDFLEY